MGPPDKGTSSATLSYTIRTYRKQDRQAVRDISCQTAFLEHPYTGIFDDAEILADVLTAAYTDHAADACLVAVVDNTVVGYLIGSEDSARISRITFFRILPMVFLKALSKMTFFSKTNARFFVFLLRSFLRGEFHMPDLSNAYPGTLHINIRQGYRHAGIGKALIRRFEDILRQRRCPGIHFCTLSDKAKRFFLTMGCSLVFTRPRTYVHPYTGTQCFCHVFAKRLSL